MRPGLRAVVEPEHRGDDAVQLVGQRDIARAAAILADQPMLEALELHAEGRLELRDRARQHDEALDRIDARDREAALLRECLDFHDVVGMRAETLGERLARDRLHARIAAREALQQ